MKRLGIIAAIPAERSQFEKVLGKELECDVLGHFSVKKYLYKDIEIYFAGSGMGEIMASACTQYLITKYKVEMILNYGFAGNVYGNNIGDKVILSGVVHYAYDTSSCDKSPAGKYQIFDTIIIPTNEELQKLALSVDDSAKLGIGASADKFVADKETKDYLHKTFNGSVCDMEAAGILFIANNSSVPALIIKIVSDGDGGSEDYYAFKKIFDNSTHEFINFLLKILDKFAN